MSRFVQTVSKALLLTYFTEGLKATMITKFPENIWFNIAVVGILALIFIIIGALVTRWKENWTHNFHIHKTVFSTKEI